MFSVVVCLSISVFGQTEKGNFLIGAGTNLGFASLSSELEYNGDSQDVGSSKVFDITLGAGYFVSDNIVIGLQVPYERTSIEDSDGEEETMTVSAIAPFLRGYIGGSDTVKPFLEAGIGFGSVKEEATNIDYERSEDMFLYTLNAGVSVFLNEVVALDIALGYAHSSMELEDSDVKIISKGFASNIGFAIFL